MRTDKTIKEWMGQIDAISEETHEIEEVADYGQNETVNNIIDMLISLKAEMQEILDTQYTEGG